MEQVSPADLRWQRDECRARCAQLTRENERLEKLLSYAKEAIRAEYELRVSASEKS